MTEIVNRPEEEKVGTQTATILPFPGTKERPIELGTACGGVWTCGCGGQDWALYANGVCLCRGCNCISTVLKVVQDRIPEAT